MSGVDWRVGDGYVLRVEVADAGVEVPSRVDGVCVEVHATGPVTAGGMFPALDRRRWRDLRPRREMIEHDDAQLVQLRP